MRQQSAACNTNKHMTERDKKQNTGTDNKNNMRQCVHPPAGSFKVLQVQYLLPIILISSHALLHRGGAEFLEIAACSSVVITAATRAFGVRCEV